MSYIDAVKIKEDVLVWERVDGKRKLKTYQTPYYYYVKDPKGEYTSMYGDKLKRKDFPNSKSFYENKSRERKFDLFESDLPAEFKVLSKEYYDVPAPKMHMTLYDIEIDYDPDLGFAGAQNPYAPINSIALYNMWEKKYIVLAVPPNLAPNKANEDTFVPGPAPEEFINELNKISDIPSDVTVEVEFFVDELRLLQSFMHHIEDSDVLAGWNSDLFDAPYIAKRALKYSKSLFRKLVPEGAPDPKFRQIETMMGTTQETVDLRGRLSADYMVLFKKYEMAMRPSYKLESIAEEMLPDLPKLEYEGSLASLYRQNFAWFVRYNIRDTEILQGLEERLGYIELANQMMHISTGVWKNVTGTLKLAEYAVVNYCHHKLGGLIVNDFQEDDAASIKGAFVLIPQTGEHKNIGSIDINSLYPSSIRAINISPETLMGQFIDEVKAVEEIAKDSDVVLTCKFDNTTQVPDIVKGRTKTAKASEWRVFLKTQNWAVSGFGTIFDQNKQGIIPKILEDWYGTRKQYQKMKGQAKAEGENMKATYYDKLQYIFKIKLNSFYGALTNAWFRFYDLRMGESTTGTGRMILIHQCAEVCKILDGEYALPDVVRTDDDGNENVGYSDKWSVVYGDTDSSYFVTHAQDSDSAVLIADRVGEMVSDSFEPFMKKTFLCNAGFSDKILCGREIVSDNGIFVDKKRYILHIIDNEGDKVDKLKVMGLDTKKTTLPKEVSKILNNYVERYLKGDSWDAISQDIVDYKEFINTTEDIMYIGLPKGVKKVEHYTGQYETFGDDARLPGHVAASIFYNICREKFQDKESMAINSGMKIKVFYLRQKHGRFISIAIPVDIEQIPDWFRTFEIDRDKHIQRLVDNPLNNIFRAIGKKTPSKQDLLVDDLLGF